MYKNILVVVELSDHNPQQLFDAALHLVSKEPEAQIQVIGVVAAPKNTIISSFLPKNFNKVVIKEATNTIHKLTVDLVNKFERVQHIVAYGNIAEEVINSINIHKNDLIIVKASEDGKEGLRSSTVKIARKVVIPLLLMR